MMLVPIEVPRDVPEAAPVPSEAEGGGGTTLVAIVAPEMPDGERPPEETVGGGGTTSWVPKSFPIMLLTSDPLAV